MNRTEQTASCPQSCSSRAGPQGQTHQRPTQSSACKGGWPLSSSRAPDAGAPPCETLASVRRGPGQGSLVNPDALGPVPSENVHPPRTFMQGMASSTAAVGGIPMHPYARGLGHALTTPAAVGRQGHVLWCEGSPRLTSRDPLTLHSLGRGLRAPAGPGRPVLTPKHIRSKS